MGLEKLSKQDKLEYFSEFSLVMVHNLWIINRFFRANKVTLNVLSNFRHLDLVTNSAGECAYKPFAHSQNYLFHCMSINNNTVLFLICITPKHNQR